MDEKGKLLYLLDDLLASVEPGDILGRISIAIMCIVPSRTNEHHKTHD